MLRWFEDAAAGSDVIISSRVRLARNLSAYPFSTRISSEQTDKMLSDVGKVLIKDATTSGYRDYILSDLEELQKEALVERNVVTRFLSNQEKAMFFVSEDEKNTVMLNEEDHIRIQCIESGMNLEECYRRADYLDNRVGDKVSYAYDDTFGYLTTCPSNVGTGMKASLMMHLPALGNSKKIQELMNEVGRFGINMKGLYGEDGSGCGHIYQISTQKTLGQSEREILNNLENIANQICSQERECRRQVFKKERLKLEDEIYKSYGILKYSRMLKYKDAMLFLSELRLGLAMGLVHFQEQTEFVLYQLMIGIQPANLKMIMGENITESELEQKRSEFIRENLPLIN